MYACIYTHIIYRHIYVVVKTEEEDDAYDFTKDYV